MRSSNSFCYVLRRQQREFDMLQRARTALPLTKIRERAFEGAFFSVTLIAMAGWIYFITLFVVKVVLWFLG